jgi:hypothetical protein
VAIPAARQRLVWERAAALCEYCRVPVLRDTSPFCIDHIIALKHHGLSDEQNLALSCYDCNAFKLDNIAGVDMFSGQVTRLFHPRRDRWQDHFSWKGAALEGKDDVGRTTIDVLRINDAERIELRLLWMELGWMQTN